MDHLTGANLMAIYQRLEIAMAEANAIIQDFPDQAERSKHLRELGDMMSHWVSLQMLVAQQHPDLDPDQRSRDGAK